LNYGLNELKDRSSNSSECENTNTTINVLKFVYPKNRYISLVTRKIDECGYAV